MIIIPSSRHISVFAFTSPMFGLCGRAIVGDRPSFDSLLGTWPNIASCSVFTQAPIFHSRRERKRRGPLSTSVKAIKGVSLFLATGDYLAYRRVSCSGSPPSPLIPPLSHFLPVRPRQRPAAANNFSLSVLSAKRNPTPKDTKLA